MEEDQFAIVTKAKGGEVMTSMEVECEVDITMGKSSPDRDSLLRNRKAGYPPQIAPSTSTGMEEKLKMTTFGSTDVTMREMLVETENDCGSTENDRACSYRRNGMC